MPEIEGVIQISAYYSQTKEFIFHVEDEYRKEIANHNNCEIVNISNYQSVYYTINDVETTTLQYFWIIGYENVKLFCSLIINSDQLPEKISNAYTKALSILNTLQINPIKK